MTGRGLTDEEIEALEGLAELAAQDPASYRQALSEAVAEADREAHAEALLALVDDRGKLRKKADAALLDTIVQATLKQGDQQ